MNERNASLYQTYRSYLPFDGQYITVKQRIGELNTAQNNTAPNIEYRAYVKRWPLWTNFIKRNTVKPAFRCME